MYTFQLTLPIIKVEEKILLKRFNGVAPTFSSNFQQYRRIKFMELMKNFGHPKFDASFRDYFTLKVSFTP